MMPCSPAFSPLSRAHVWLCAIALPFAMGACDGGDGAAPDDSASMGSASMDGSTSTDTGNTGMQIELGWGQEGFTPLQEGGSLEVVWGTQGSAMFPIIVRGTDLPLPADPGDWMDEAAPTAELWLDIEGYNNGFGGHFKRIANYPLGFEIADDGSQVSTFIALLMPDDVQPEELAGLPATLWLELSPFESEPISAELDLVIAVGDPPG